MACGARCVLVSVNHAVNRNYVLHVQAHVRVLCGHYSHTHTHHHHHHYYYYYYYYPTQTDTHTHVPTNIPYTHTRAHTHTHSHTHTHARTHTHTPVAQDTAASWLAWHCHSSIMCRGHAAAKHQPRHTLGALCVQGPRCSQASAKTHTGRTLRAVLVCGPRCSQASAKTHTGRTLRAVLVCGSKRAVLIGKQVAVKLHMALRGAACSVLLSKASKGWDRSATPCRGSWGSLYLPESGSVKKPVCVATGGWCLWRRSVVTCSVCQGFVRVPHPQPQHILQNEPRFSTPIRAWGVFRGALHLEQCFASMRSPHKKMHTFFSFWHESGDNVYCENCVTRLM